MGTISTLVCWLLLMKSTISICFTRSKLVLNQIINIQRRVVQMSYQMIRIKSIRWTHGEWVRESVPFHSHSTCKKCIFEWTNAHVNYLWFEKRFNFNLQKKRVRKHSLVIHLEFNHSHFPLRAFWGHPLLLETWNCYCYWMRAF